MSALLPEKITFQFSNANLVGNGLIVYVVLETKYKNNYTIGPLLTDSNGKFILNRELIEEIISESKNDSPMDYECGLNECSALKLIVETKNELLDRVARLEEFYPDSANTLKSLLLSSANGDYGFVKEIELPIDSNEILLNHLESNQDATVLN